MNIEPVLYMDPQAAVPRHICPRCGERCFAPEGCLRCGRETP